MKFNIWNYLVIFHSAIAFKNCRQKSPRKIDAVQLEPLSIRDEIKLPLLRSLSGGSLIAAIFTANKFYNEDKLYVDYHKELFQQYIKHNQTILEIGFGDGANLDYYPPGVHLTGLDPRTVILRKDILNNIKSRAIQFKGLVTAVGENIPFPNSSFDVVVSSLVLCSVKSPELVLKEISRVLKKNGYFICIEHILGEHNSLLELQHKTLDPLQQALADGCHLTRQTDVLLESSVPALFSEMSQLKYLELSGQWPISRQIVAALRK